MERARLNAYRWIKGVAQGAAEDAARSRAGAPPLPARARLRRTMLPPAVLRGMHGAAAFLLLAVLPSCAPQPLLDLTFGPPPLVTSATAKRGITDERGRFREILCAVTAAHGDQFIDQRPCDDVLIRTPEESAGTGQRVYLGPARKKLRIATVSGLGADCLAGVVKPFDYSVQHLETLGYRTTEIPIRGLASSTYNASIISDSLLNMNLEPDEKVVLIGYSKGSPDVLEALSMYPRMADKVAAFISISGVVSGTLLAEGAPEFALNFLKLFPGGTCASADLGAVESLRRSVRLKWFGSHDLPKSVQYYSVPTYAERSNISSFLRAGYDELSRIDPRNDGKMLYYDQIIPGSRLLGFVNSDHWAAVVPIAHHHAFLENVIATKNEFPREVLLEAIIRQVEENLLEEPVVASQDGAGAAFIN